MNNEEYKLAVKETVEYLRKGGIILYPTDTIWGLGCDACNPEAVAKIYEIKKRSDSKSLVLLASDLNMLARYIKEIPFIVPDLIEVNDKPMTIIYPGAISSKPPVPGKKAMCDRRLLAYNAVAEDGTVAIRIPDMDFCRDVIFRFARPIVSTSANISGQASPKYFDDIDPEIVSAVDYVVDAELEKGSTRMASQILKIGLGGEVKIIRE